MVNVLAALPAEAHAFVALHRFPGGAARAGDTDLIEQWQAAGAGRVVERAPRVGQVALEAGAAGHQGIMVIAIGHSHMERSQPEKGLPQYPRRTPSRLSHKSDACVRRGGRVTEITRDTRLRRTSQRASRCRVSSEGCRMR